MAGMIQILNYLLCVYLVYKGIEIYLISLTVQDEEKAVAARGIAKLALALAVGIAIAFALWMDSQAESLSRGLQNIR
jgi:hypothetical protein